MDKRKSKDKGSSSSSKNKIVDLSNYRKSLTEERKRAYERVLFNRILGVYSFVERSGLHHVEIVDISFSGIKFRESRPTGTFTAEEKIALRFYFTPSSYLRVAVDIARASTFQEKDREGMEYGCKIDTNTKSYEVISQLISFMQKYSELACEDSQPPLIWF